MTSVIWNWLPSHIRDTNLSELVFKSRLKKYLLEIQLKSNVEISNGHGGISGSIDNPLT